MKLRYNGFKKYFKEYSSLDLHLGNWFDFDFLSRYIAYTYSLYI